ncbi:MAG: geranylgeranylglycerol-phosphate geranylgeranyltransferase [Bacteroidales bacterium]|nr:geranylgeranylglycerol-phosphate geranylgeranyltransferase [Bacteroidales bacterium]
MNAYLKLIRWPNLLIMAVAMFLVRYYLVRGPLLLVGTDLASTLVDFVLLVVAMLFISAAGYVINDVFDMDIDSLNKQEKQIVGRLIPVQTAKRLYWLLSAAGMLIMVYLGYRLNSWQLTLIVLMLTGLLWFYSERYKRQILVGNLVVAFIASAGITVVWLFEFFSLVRESDGFIVASAAMPLMSGLVFAYALFAFLSTLTREMVKDIEDMSGDARFGCRTFPVVYGQITARNLSAATLIILIIMIGFWQYILYFREMTQAMMVLFLALGIGIFALIRLALANKPEHYGFVSSLLKLLMLAGLLSVVFLKSM